METIIIAILGSGALSALVSGVFTLIANRKNKETAERKAMRLIMYRTIKQDAQAYIERGYVRPDELEDIVAYHNCYHSDLGGNGFLDSLMDKVKRLPVQMFCK